MQREFREIGEEYQRANTEGFASIVRSMQEVNKGLRGIVSEMTEYSQRSIRQALEIQAQLARMAFGPYDQAIDTTTPTGRLMFNMLGAIAQFERELIRERMLVGIAKAKAEGKYKGRAPTARAKADKVKQLRAAGVGPSEIARQLSISRTSVFRILTA